ncbi:DEAD/DEAH box helicase [Cooperia oncophora]
MSDDEERDYSHLQSEKKSLKQKNGRRIGRAPPSLDHTVFKGIEKKGFKQPTPIQRKTIPCILDGKDVVAMSRTGSGKTAAFVIPMLQRLKRRDTRGIRALLVSPTRELALQTFKVVKEIDRNSWSTSSCHSRDGSAAELCTVVVSDEADRLFEMGFQDQLTETLKRIPESRQTLLFSATLPKMLVDFAKAGLSDPMLVRLDVDEKISDRLSMVFATCRADDKLEVLLHICRQMDAEGKQTVVFCATMKHVEYVVGIMNRAGIDNSFIYSQLDATARKLNIAKGWHAPHESYKCYLMRLHPAIVTTIAPNR